MGRKEVPKPNVLPNSYLCNVCSTEFRLPLLGEMCVQSTSLGSNQFRHEILAGICQACTKTHTINSVAVVVPRAQTQEETDPQISSQE